MFKPMEGTKIEWDDEKGMVLSCKKETDAPTIYSPEYIFFGELEVETMAAPGAVSAFIGCEPLSRAGTNTNLRASLPALSSSPTAWTRSTGSGLEGKLFTRDSSAIRINAISCLASRTRFRPTISPREMTLHSIGVARVL